MLWHLLLCGYHLLRVTGEVEGYCFASPTEQGEIRDHPYVWRAETTAWQVGMGTISCFKGGMAWPVGDRQDGFADK